MICLIQRVSHGQVTVQQKTIGKINKGLVVLVGFQAEDNHQFRRVPQRNQRAARHQEAPDHATQDDKY